MIYENPPVPEADDAGRNSLLGEFLRLLTVLVIGVVVVGGLLYVGGGWIARFVPYEYEVGWMGDEVLGIDPARRLARDTADLRYVQQLTDRLAAAMELPPGMMPRVHFFDLGAPNAFATLGGHIVITDDLYRQMPSENALAFVLAHEIAHIEARDPIAGFGGGALLTLGLVLLGGSEEQLAPFAATGVQRGFSQRAERRADAAAIEAVRKVYGHAGDAASVFRIFAAEEAKALVSFPSLFDTHPPTAERLEALTRAAADWNPATQPLRPLNRTAN